MTVRIVVATKNQGKIRELTRLFDEPRIQLLGFGEVLPENFCVEETGATFVDNAWLKAEQVALRSGLPAIADDSGLEVDALGGRPGVYSARYAGPDATDEDNNRLLLQDLEGVPAGERTARFACVLAFAVPKLGESDAERVAWTHGTIEGRIIASPRGEGGFGYDPLFEPLCLDGKTTAEIPLEEKNRISHRAQAASKMRDELNRWLMRG
jgi:XTP/dITP diphosphohydrolase